MLSQIVRCGERTVLYCEKVAQCLQFSLVALVVTTDASGGQVFLWRGLWEVAKQQRGIRCGRKAKPLCQSMPHQFIILSTTAPHSTVPSLRGASGVFQVLILQTLAVLFPF